MEIKKCIMLFLVTIWHVVVIAQKPVYVYRNFKDSTQNFYVVRPPAAQVIGAVVLINRGLSDSTKKKAYAKGVLLMTAVLAENYLDFLTDDHILERLDSMINEVTVKYKVPAGKIVIGGMSVAGTAAIRFAEYCAVGNSVFKFKPAAVFAVDPPLDYERMYNEAENAVRRNFNADAVLEGRKLMTFLKDKLGGAPTDDRATYEKVSPFSHTAKEGGNAPLLKNMHIRMYTEPDINWWIDNRRKDFYDLNVLDIAALINELKIMGNNRAELIVTNAKGYTEEGNRHPHAWSIVDEDALLAWCIQSFR
jgi:hypothetical protein